MAERLDLADILKMNPHIKPGELEELQEMLRKLRSGGHRDSRYRLAPIGRRQAFFDEEAANKARAIRLVSSRQQL